MRRISKTFALLLTLIIAISCLTLLTVKSANDQTTSPTLEWSKTYGPYEGNGILQTNDGGYIIAGINATFKPFAPHSPSEYINEKGLLIKTDNEGNIVWQKTYGDNYPNSRLIYSISQTNDSGYLICGNGDWLLKVDSNGNQQWEKSFGIGKINSTFEFGNIQFNGLYPVSDGYILVGSLSSDTIAGYNSFVIKVDSNGNMIWKQLFLVGTLTGPQNVDINSVIETNDGHYIVVGDWNGHAWLSEISSGGNLLANKTYTNLDFFTSGIAEKNNQFLLTASTGLPNSQQRYTVYFVQVDTNLNILSTKTCDSDSNLYQLKQDFAGNYVAVSWHTYVTDNSDLKGYLMGFDINGKLRWNATLIGETAGKALFSSTFTLTKEGYAVTGSQYDSEAIQQSIFLQTFRLSSPIPTPSPTVPEFPSAILGIAILMTITTSILFYSKKQSYKR